VIAEFLIRAHRLIGVKDLYILGGDGALFHLDKLQALAAEYKMTIHVYAIKGDPVTLSPLGWDLRAYGESLHAQVASYLTQPNLAYDLLGLRRRAAEPRANLQVTLFDYPHRDWPLDYHMYTSYSGLLKGQRMMGCLEGSTDSRCRINY
jgi:hypothetical protein